MRKVLQVLFSYLESLEIHCLYGYHLLDMEPLKLPTFRVWQRKIWLCICEKCLWHHFIFTTSSPASAQQTADGLQPLQHPRNGLTGWSALNDHDVETESSFTFPLFLSGSHFLLPLVVKQKKRKKRKKIAAGILATTGRFWTCSVSKIEKLDNTLTTLCGYPSTNFHTLLARDLFHN